MITHTYLRTRQMQMLGYLRQALQVYGYSETEIVAELTRLNDRFITCDYVGGDSTSNSYHLKLSKRLTKLYINYAFTGSKMYSTYKEFWRNKYYAEVKALRMENPSEHVFSFEHYFSIQMNRSPIKIRPELLNITSKADISI